MNEYTQYMYELFPDARPPVPLLEKEGDDKPITSAGGQEPVSKAAETARKLGLHHTAYGYWADSTGKVVAQSVTLSDGTTQLVRLNREVPSDADNKSSDDPTSADDLDVDNDPDRNAISQVSSNKETLANMGALQKFPDKFKKFLHFAFKQQYDNSVNPESTVIKYGDRDNPKELKLFRLSPNSKIGSFPGLMTNTEGGKMPSHLILGKKAIPLVYTNLKDPSKSFNIYKDVMAAAAEFYAATQASAPQKQKKEPPKEVPAPVEVPAEVPAETPTEIPLVQDRKKLQAISKSVHRYLNEVKESVERRNNGVTTVEYTQAQYEILQSAVADLDKLLENPSADDAILFIEKYEMRTNSKANKFTFEVLKQFNSDDAPNIDNFFDRSKDIFTNRSDYYSKNIQGDVLHQFFKDILGKDNYENHVRTNVTLKTLCEPSYVFRHKPVVNIQPTIGPLYTADVGNDMLDFGGIKLPLIVPIDKSVAQIQMLVEQLQLYEQKARSIANTTGALHGISNPTELDIQRVSKTVSDAVVMYQKRLKVLQSMHGNHIQFNGTADLKTYVADVKLQITNAARTSKDGAFNDEQIQILNMLDTFAEVPEGVEPDADFNDKWVTFVQKFARDPRLRYIASALAEHMSALMALRKNKTVFFSKMSNGKSIDHIAITPQSSPVAPSLEELLDVDSNISMMLSDIDLTSVKSGVTHKTDAQGNLKVERGGATPAISGLVNFHEFDPNVNPAIIKFFKKGLSDFGKDDAEKGLQYASKLLDDIFNDEYMQELLCNYYGISIANASTRMTRLRQHMLKTNNDRKAKGKEIEDPTSLLFGKIGEAVLNAGATHQLMQNQTFTSGDIQSTDSKNVIVKWRYAGDIDGSLSSFNMVIDDIVAPEYARTEKPPIRDTK